MEIRIFCIDYFLLEVMWSLLEYLRRKNCYIERNWCVCNLRFFSIVIKVNLDKDGSKMSYGVN